MHAKEKIVEAADENFWAGIRECYSVCDRFINLENGYFSPQAKPVFEAFEGYNKLLNEQTSYFYRVSFPELRESVLRKLAEFSGASAEELLITRNATEAMNITIQGYPCAADDEVVLGHHDFDSVVATFHMLRERKGLKINYVHVPLHPATDGEIVDLYRRAITPKTRVILVTHVIHTTGQILPVRKIAQMTREHGVDIMVDAAHSFAHIDCQLSDLGSDFVAVNLHKWLGAPLGAGLLYIAKHRVKDIAPLYGDAAYEPESIIRLGHFGAVPTAPILAISDAIDFHNSIGGRNKEARLRYLRTRWMDNVKDLRHVELLTPLAPERACAIGAFRIKNMPSKDVVEHLLSVHRIFTVERTIDGGRGVRVTPHLYNTIDDIDRLTRALQLLM